MMYFKELLRVRKALLWYTITVALIAGFIVIVALVSPPDSNAHTDVVRIKHTDHGVVTTSTARLDEVPWAALFGGAGFVAAIMATVLGSTLAQENAHLEVAWTKPRSRTRYATTLMAVDAAGIIIAQLIAFALIVVPIVLFGKGERLANGPDDALNVVRFLLFPLAWYGLIVAFTASVRGRAGMVQGLIWPITLTLAVLGQVPLPQIWHRIFAAINAINPVSYIEYRSHGSDVHIITSAGLPNVVLAAVVLALMVAVSWWAATFQWRRLQA
ncbi:MAG TPA: hypothetical protein VIX35_11115 [Vicinamibacterales bacterium]